MTGDQKRAIAREIAELIATPELQEGWITAAIYAAEMNIPYKKAADDLARAAKRGIIERDDEKVLHKGAWQWAYCVKEEMPME